MSGAATDALLRAVDLSRELKAAADQGDTQSAMRLDVARLELLKFARHEAAGALGADERRLLQEIAQLNDESLGLLEHLRRSKARQLDMVAVGRRALVAYSSTRMQR
jgi:predicted nucleic acid-binding protein